jgi:hypothetical protein
LNALPFAPGFTSQQEIHSFGLFADRSSRIRVKMHEQLHLPLMLTILRPENFSRSNLGYGEARTSKGNKERKEKSENSHKIKAGKLGI